MNDTINLRLASTPEHLFRWVDDKGAGYYLRSDAMIGRHRHFLPAKISGLFHSKFQTGLSFGMNAHQWGLGGTVCFVVARAKIDVAAHVISGEAIYRLSDFMTRLKLGAGFVSTQEAYPQRLREAVAECLAEPDEVFVVPALRNLAAKLVEIRHRNATPKTVRLLEGYCETHNLPLRKA